MDDFDGSHLSDIGAFFAEVDRLEAKVPLQPVRPSYRPTHPPAPPALSSPANMREDQSKTPQLSRTAEVPAVTPRSSKEIRQIFAKRPAVGQTAAAIQQPAAQNQQALPVSRFHAQASVQPGDKAVHVSRSYQQPVMQTATAAATGYQQQAPLQPQALPGTHQQPSASFDQFACHHPAEQFQQARGSTQYSDPGCHQSAAMYPQTGAALPQHANQPTSLMQRNSAPSSCGSANISDRQHSGQQAGPSARNSTASAAPAMSARAEIFVGDGASLEVNVRSHSNIAAVLKRLAGEWISSKGCWRIPITHYSALLSGLKSIPNVQLTVDPLPPAADLIVKMACAAPDDSERFDKLPAKLKEKLMGFQREGVLLALKRGGRLLIGDEMGLGKTVQAIAIMACYRDEWPCVIVTPSSLREQWADALHQWLGITDEHVHMVTKGKHCKDLTSKKFQFVITSYNFMKDLRGPLEDLVPQVMVLDEAHMIKAKDSVRTKETLPILKAAKRVVLLTGTPALSRPKELFPLLSALVPSSKLTMKAFGERYCQLDPWKQRFGGVYDGASNLPELNKLLSSTVMVRRLKADVLEQLPPKRRQQVFLQLQDAELSQMKGLKASLQKARELKQSESGGFGGQNGGKGGAMGKDGLVMELYQKCALIKKKAVAEHVSDLLEADQKFLIFSHHADMHNAVEEAVRKKKVKFIRIDGGTPPETRSGLVDKFQNNTDVRVAILSINAAGTGLTLTAASTVVFAEYSWTPGTLVQAEDRVHRIGQANSVNICYLHVKGSIDDIIWQTLEHKLDDIGQVLNGKSDSFGIIKAQQQVSANQGKLDHFMAPSQSCAVGAALPDKCANSSQRDAHMPSASEVTHPPTDITNLPPVTGAKADNRAQAVPQQAKQAVSLSMSQPAGQAKLQSFFQPKQNAPAALPPSSRPSASWVKQKPVQGDLQQQQQHQKQQQQQQHPQQQYQQQQQSQLQYPLQQCPTQQYPPQQHVQQQQHVHPQQGYQALHQQPASQQAAKASGVFADEDDDIVWPQDDVFVSHATPLLPANSGLPQPADRIQSIDLTGPTYKKARTSV